ncbi:MAG: DUF2808 domain-containing protein [Cyanobium sp.]
MACSPRLSAVTFPAAVALLLGAATLPWHQAPLHALELNGSTVFVRAPWKADLISYRTNVGDAQVAYYLTLSLDPEAGASLARLTVQQTRGADRSFPFSPELTEAFLGRPRQEGARVPVRAAFEASSRRITVDFPEPVAPGQTVTVVLRPWTNPQAADTYQFQVVVWPAGPDPLATPVGTVNLRIYDRFSF